MYKYDIGDELRVNMLAKIGMPNYVGRVGLVHQKLENSTLYDYELKFDNSTYGKFKEEELEGVVVVNSENESNDEIKIDVAEDLLEVFLSQYKNTDDTYTVPKQLLVSMINQLYTFVEVE